MEGTLQRLREFQGEKVAYGYLRQFSSPARGRALNGLGQVTLWVLAGATEFAAQQHRASGRVEVLQAQGW